MASIENRRHGALKFTRIAMVAATAALVSGCGGFREQLGLNKQAPDEFAVVTKAPLSLPPDYTLRPPAPGAPRPQELRPRDQARAALIEQSANTDGTTGRSSAVPQQATASGAGNPSQGEASLLRLAGAENADPGIRRLVAEENTQIVEQDRSFADLLMFWQTQPPFGTVVEPTEEAARLQRNAAVGRSVTEGETPMIRRRKRAIFEGIF